jgi:putative ABC transport system permease protein
MIRSYIKIAWRNLVKNPQFTFLNIVGLSTGMACALLIYLWVNEQLQVDKFHKNHNNIYQVMHHMGGDGSIGTIEQLPAPAAKALATEMPEVEQAAMAEIDELNSEGFASVNEKKIKAKRRYVTGNFFRVFSFNLIHGNRGNLFPDKHNVLISEKLAVILFRSIPGSIGQTIGWNEGDTTISYQVSGVFSNPPENSTAQFDILFSYEHKFDKVSYAADDWEGSSTALYLVLKDGTDTKKFDQKITRFLRSKREDWLNFFSVQKYSDKYLYNTFKYGLQTGGRIEYVRLFSAIALCILLIACVNFTNLTTANAAMRTKEIGVKKVCGASMLSLILQFLTESLVITFFSLIMAIGLTVLLLPGFNAVVGKQIELGFDLNTILSVLAITVFTSLLSGSYPAIYLSKFKPAALLKGKIKTSLSEQFIRKGLVILQFTLSAIFIVAVLVINKQMELVQTAELGYKKDNIISFKNEGPLKENLETFLTEVKKLPGVEAAAHAETDLSANHGGMSGVVWPEKKPQDSVSFGIIMVGHSYMDMMGFAMKEGRMFSEKFGADDSKIIFSESAIAAMGLKDPVGKTVFLEMFNSKKEIIGVAKDFHYESMHKKVAPSFFIMYPGGRNVLIKISTGNEQKAIQKIRQLYQSFNRGIAFEFRFLDDEYQALYVAEQRVATLSRYFAIMGVTISCLGLFGLAAFTSHKRQKEIAIRKVMGATMGNVAFILSKDFLMVVLASVLIAFPVSWWITESWLEGFAYRIHINAGIFVAAGMAILLVTLLTISYHTIKAAVSNPIRSLRAE